MGGRRKVFRIEETVGALRPQTPAEPPQQPLLAEIMQELTALRAQLAGTPEAAPVNAPTETEDEIQRLTSELRLVRSAIVGGEHGTSREEGRTAASAARIAGELEAVVAGSEHATQKILAAAEDIDQAANTLSAVLKDDSAHGLAQDIRDRVIQIFEACNYQDLTSQRVAKVTTALGRIERQIARALNESRSAEPPLHGPRLPNDRGHVSQSDVDTMFSEDSPAIPTLARAAAG
jgi:chemotaxis protein CheZ